ncbi:hypothetical protein JCM21900_005264 [Sporobolomyces salmonicolor]
MVRPHRASAIAARNLAAAAQLAQSRSSRSPSSSLTPPPPTPPRRDSDEYEEEMKGEGASKRARSESPLSTLPPAPKKKRTRKPKEPVAYVIPPVEHLETNFKGRLGYACLNTILRKEKPSVFCSRTCRIDTITTKGLSYLKALGRQNMEDLTKLIEWNAKHHIFFMRMSSEMFPFAAHPDYQYSLDYAEKELKLAGDTAERLGVRLTTHPGQFTQLGSPRRQVVENAYRDLEYHNEMMDRMGLGKDSVMIIHGGGVYGDKAAAIERFKINYKELSQGCKDRLVLENDEICFNVDDLLPLCEELNIPLVFDYHHDWLFPSSQTPAELMPRILATWHRKGIKPKFHLSEPRRGAETLMEKRAHADRCQRLPDPLPEDIDLMIEAKDKEQAVFHLHRIYSLQPVLHESLRPPAEVETKQTAGRKSSKKKAPKAQGGDDVLNGADRDGTAQKAQVEHALEDGVAPLPEGVDAEGQEYTPVKGEKGTDLEEKSCGNKRGKGKGKVATPGKAERKKGGERRDAEESAVQDRQEQEVKPEGARKARTAKAKKAVDAADENVRGVEGASALQ